MTCLEQKSLVYEFSFAEPSTVILLLFFIETNFQLKLRS